MDRAKRLVRRLIKPVALLAAAVMAGIAGASVAGTEVMKKDEISPDDGRR
jgi:hypothetical protein